MALKNPISSRVMNGSSTVWWDAPSDAMSSAGDNATMAAGNGRPRSRARTAVDKARLPPAESPASTMADAA